LGKTKVVWKATKTVGWMEPRTAVWKVKKKAVMLEVEWGYMWGHRSGHM